MEMPEFKSPWWREYRRRMYRHRERLSNEQIFRKSLKENSKEYFRNCTLAGMNHFTGHGVSLLERAFWAVMLGLVIGMLFYCLAYIWGNLSQPLIVTMESSTYDIGNIDFPAVAICNINRVSRRAIDHIAATAFDDVKYGFDDDKFNISYFKWLVGQTGRLINFEYSESFDKNISSLDKLNGNFDPRNLIQIMETVSPNCSEMLLRCTWAGRVTPCERLFAVRRTVRGHCCAFNYILNYDGAKSTIAKSKRQTVRGPRNGLNVLMDPLKDDYQFPLHPMVGFEVFLFDPTHFADLNGGRVVHRFIDINAGKLMQLQSRKQLATDEVRKYSLETRKCLFHDDYYSVYRGMYSMSACIIRCRIKTVLSLCKCVPYFLPTRDHEPVCSLDNLRCLNKYREKFMFLFPVSAESEAGLEQDMHDSMFCPECAADCEHTQHSSQASTLELTSTRWPGKHHLGPFFNDVNFTGLCFMSVFQPTQDGVLDRLDVVYYWFELLSNVGGFGGVLLGFSMITIVEIVYFTCIRFVIIMRSNYIAYH
ncbi:unnamed protein product [Plutella xylostella]|uniref:(diamondback moth) hypothetical protein n=1 Tax=Plutella xylostella TaxID=51655 RepID=A0A8S4FN47_PLUXY|nr:unnamed protein product [Plutella xylostella]